ncbi:hypothetical protein [Mucilaginibacter jinjuensis]|uniref:Uncharacterized protein n=1 Tax=Mucilaginibacter jinjuensis TaxID=1176721 RepID=A0ABY7T5X3_9SPHI|nr:hypothetical protein [Mucilaginibacter jinjuensis]WCT11644.1 hypothetical protein PQO05_23195 [Mucilaginibacter jinjuensis]
MKIIKTTQPVHADELEHFLNEELNPLFQEQRHADISFSIVNNDGAIEITNPELYDSFLYRIEIQGTEMHIIKSEHYTDDVNSLTLEEILNGLFLEYPGRKKIKNIEDAS